MILVLQNELGIVFQKKKKLWIVTLQPYYLEFFANSQ